MEKRLIVGLGEVLWDMFPSGERFGGAPANFACSFAGIANKRHRVAVASGIGEDELGRRAKVSLSDRGVETDLLQTNRAETGKVLVELDDEGVASYRFADDSAWDHLKLTGQWSSAAARCGVVCFGTLGQRTACSRSTIIDFVSSMPADALKIFDVNLRPPHYNAAILRDSLAVANVAKLNEDELPILAELFELSGEESDQLHQLCDIFHLRCAALTKGAEGAVVVSEGQTCHEPGQMVVVADTVGAGDAFTAGLALGLLHEGELETITRQATKLAAYVCTQTGATPDLSVLPFPIGFP